MPDVVPFLMFCGPQAGKAEEAMATYTAAFADAAVLSTDRWGPDDPEPDGTLRSGVFTIGSQRIRVMDSSGPHEFGFTPATSLFVECTTEDELRRAGTVLSEGGSWLMPLGDHGFSRLFGWVADRYGMTWQLNLPA